MGEEEGEGIGEEGVRGGGRVRVRVLEFFDEAGVAGGAEDVAGGGGGDGDGALALVAEEHLRAAFRHRDAAGGHICDGKTEKGAEDSMMFGFGLRCNV